MFGFFKGKEEREGRLEQAIKRIEEECSRTLAEEVYPLVELLYELTWNIPASETHHDAGEGGLFEHSIEVAIHCWQKMEKHIGEVVVVGENGNIRSYETETLRKQYMRASFVLGLVHDIGKIVDWEPEPKRKGGFIREYFPLELKGLKGTPRRVEHRRDMSHHLISVMLLYESLRQNPDYLRWDTEVYVKLVEALALEHYPFSTMLQGENLFLRILKESDSEAVESSVEEVTYEKVMSSREKKEKTYTYIDYIRDLVLRGEVKVNSDFFQVWIDREKDHILVNMNIGVDRALRELKLPDKIVLVNVMKNLGILIPDPAGKEFRKVRVGEKTFPCLVLKLSAFHFPDDLLSTMPSPPPYRLEGEEGEEEKRAIEIEA